MLNILKRGIRLVALITLVVVVLSFAAKVAVYGLYNAPTQSQNKGPLFGEPGKETLYIALPNKADHVAGDEAARVVVIAYLSFGCPECAQYYRTLRKLARQGVTVIYRHYQPSWAFGSRAFIVAHAAECVAERLGPEGFWEVADYIFANQDKIFGAAYDPLPPLLARFDMLDAPFEECKDTGRHTERIDVNTKEALTIARQMPITIVLDPRNAEAHLLIGAVDETDVQQRLMLITAVSQ